MIGKYERIASLLLNRRVFISSTARDMIDAREEVAVYLKDLGFEVIMFDWGSMLPLPGLTPPIQCVKNVSNADIFVLLLGPRWGFEIEDGRSATEAEYDAAVSLGIPRLIFIRNYVWDFVQSIRNMDVHDFEGNILQKGKEDKIVKFYLRIADSGKGKKPDMMIPFSNSVTLKQKVEKQLLAYYDHCGETKLNKNSFGGLLNVQKIQRVEIDEHRCLNELSKLGYSTIGGVVDELRKRPDIAFQNVWGIFDFLSPKYSKADTKPRIVCVDKRVITSQDVEMFKKILREEQSAGKPLCDTQDLLRSVPGAVWPAVRNFMAATAKTIDIHDSIAKNIHDDQLQNIMRYLWGQYVEEEMRHMEEVGYNRKLNFWATDTAFDDISPSIWTTEQFHLALLKSTVKMAQNKKGSAFSVVRISIVNQIDNLLKHEHFYKVYNFFETQILGGVKCGIINGNKILPEYDSCFKDFYLVPNRLLYCLLRKSNIHVLSTHEDSEGKSILREYTLFFQSLIESSVFIDEDNLGTLRHILNEIKYN